MINLNTCLLKYSRCQICLELNKVTEILSAASILKVAIGSVIWIPPSTVAVNVIDYNLLLGILKLCVIYLKHIYSVYKLKT